MMSKALKRLRIACVNVAHVLDSGKRDPKWVESQELENAAIEYGRELLKTDAGKLLVASEGDE